MKVQQCDRCGRSLQSLITRRLGTCQICDQAGYRRLRRQLGMDKHSATATQEDIVWLLNEVKVSAVVKFCAGGGVYDNSTPIIQQVKAIALRYAGEIYKRLRLTIRASQTPVEITNKLLRKINHKAIKVSHKGSRDCRAVQFTVEDL